VTIVREGEGSYMEAAREINDSECDAILIQHEFGIFGGKTGGHIVALVDALKIPYVLSLHTVLPRFSDGQSHVIHQLCRRRSAPSGCFHGLAHGRRCTTGSHRRSSRRHGGCEAQFSGASSIHATEQELPFLPAANFVSLNPDAYSDLMFDANTKAWWANAS
jgi:hypothetical protein